MPSTSLLQQGPEPVEWPDDTVIDVQIEQPIRSISSLKDTQDDKTHLASIKEAHKREIDQYSEIIAHEKALLARKRSIDSDSVSLIQLHEDVKQATKAGDAVLERITQGPVVYMKLHKSSLPELSPTSFLKTHIDKNRDVLNSSSFLQAKTPREEVNSPPFPIVNIVVEDEQ